MKNKKGFALLEVQLSLIILVAALLPILQSLVQSQQTLRRLDDASKEIKGDLYPWDEFLKTGQSDVE